MMMLIIIVCIVFVTFLYFSHKDPTV